VLLGDPQQLEQPQQGVHPPGADVSALAHLLNGHATIASEQGIFLTETRRLHPDVCAFTSELFYEGRLVPRPENAEQRLNTADPLDGTGLRFAPVNHSDNQNESPEEVEKVAAAVETLLKTGATWTNKKGEAHALTLEDVMVVAPYNAQVEALLERLPAGARVGTVDKFQGQEAPLVLYSMATSTPEDAPRGMEFLYSLNRPKRRNLTCALRCCDRCQPSAVSSSVQNSATNRACERILPLSGNGSHSLNPMYRVPFLVVT
jgi:uncharacterized protein